MSLEVDAAVRRGGESVSGIVMGTKEEGMLDAVRLGFVMLKETCIPF